MTRMLKRLKEATGAVDEQGARASDSPNQIVRRARLVHSGPEGVGVTYMSGDGETKPFDAARIKKIVDNHNARLQQLAGEYGGEDKIPLGAYDPILDSHENESNDRVIGRLTGKLVYEVQDVPKVGKACACAIAEGITFIGKENLEKVNDGRIYHLSIGINEEHDTLGETSTVVKPAAPGAMLLRKGDGKPTTPVIQTGGHMPNKETMKRLQAHQTRLTKLTAMKETLTVTTKNLVDTSSAMRLTARKNDITGRLKKLCAEGKMTPAEYKNLVTVEDLVHMAKLDDATLKIALKPYESREARVIEPGQRGSVAAMDFSQLSEGMKKSEIKNHRGEIASDFRRLSGKKLIEGEEPKKEMGGGNDLSPVNPGSNPHVVAGQAGVEKQMAEDHAALKSCLEAGDITGAKMAHEKVMSSMKGLSEYGGDVKSEDAQKSMSDQQQKIDELSTQMSRLAGMVEELMSVESEEGHDLEAGAVEGKDGKPPVAPPAAAAS